MKRCLVLLVLLVPAATALEVEDQEVTMWTNVDLTSHKVHDVDTQGCVQRPDESPFVIARSPNELQFWEDYDERGCAEARVAVMIPEGATTMRLDYKIDRDINSQPPVLEAAAVQGVRFYNQTQTPLPHHQPEPEPDPQHRDFTGPATTAEISLLEAGPNGERLEERIYIGFYFEDAFVDPNSASLAGRGVGSQQIEISILDVRVEFSGMPLTTATEDVESLHSDGTLLGFSRVRADLPPALPGFDRQATFAVDNAYSTHGFYAIVAANGVESRKPLATNDIELSEAGGKLRFTIGSDVIAREQVDSFEVHFEPPDSTVVSAAGLPIAGLALLAPIIFGVLAQRNLNHLQRTARGRLRKPRFALQASLVVGWTVYLGVVFALLIFPIGPGMAAENLPPANIVAYTALGTASFIMIAVSIAGRRREMRLVVNDLTDLERIQQELQRSNAELEQFAYVASHDLKEPLRMVAGFTQLLEQHLDDRLDDDGRKYLGFASEGSRRLQRMVDDLLLYSRVRHDRKALTKVKLDDVMVIVRGHLSQLIQDRGVELRVGQLPTITADQGQMVQMLLNLVQNAIKFSPQDNPVVEVTAKAVDGKVHLSVRDEGVGIDPGQQERIFQIFQRLHLREEYEGNGIGLAMVKKIAEQSGGHIIVNSAKGKGSTFTVVLPREPPAAATPRAVPRARRVGGAA